jgi:CO dehydrogenase/acetyl-CoA synthase epsilon subunit
MIHQPYYLIRVDSMVQNFRQIDAILISEIWYEEATRRFLYSGSIHQHGQASLA